MSSKSPLLFCFLLAALLLGASARDLGENTDEKSIKEGGLEEQKWYLGGGYPGGGYPGGRFRGGGYPGGWYPGGWHHGGGYPGGGLYCPFGCCFRGYYGFCRACCPYPGAEKETEPGN